MNMSYMSREVFMEKFEKRHVLGGGGNRRITFRNHGFNLFEILKNSFFYEEVLKRFFALLRMAESVTLNLIQSLFVLPDFMHL